MTGINALAKNTHPCVVVFDHNIYWYKNRLRKLIGFPPNVSNYDGCRSIIVVDIIPLFTILKTLGSIYRRGARRWRKLYRVNGHIFQAKRFNRVSINVTRIACGVFGFSIAHSSASVYLVLLLLFASHFVLRIICTSDTRASVLFSLSANINITEIKQ